MCIRDRQGPQGLSRACFPAGGGLQHAQIRVAQAGQQVPPVKEPVPVPAFMQAEEAVQQMEDGRALQGIAHGDAVSYTHLDVYKRQVWQFLYYMLCYVALWLACDLLGKGIFLFEGRMSWGMLFAASMVGGILSLRTRRAYACLMGMFVAVWGFLAVTRLDIF